MQTVETQTRAIQGIVGEIVPAPVAGYDPLTERALDDVGAILRRHREMTVGQARALAARVRHDAAIQAQVVTTESRYAAMQERIEHLRAKVESGAYQPQGEEVAACMLSYPAFRDYERRRDYYAERRREDWRQECGMSVSLLPDEEDGAWEEAQVRAFWQTFRVSIAVLAATLIGVMWLLLAIHTRS